MLEIILNTLLYVKCVQCEELRRLNGIHIIIIAWSI